MSDADFVQRRFDTFELDERNARLTRGGVPVPLPPKAFAVLCALARTPGTLISKEALLDQAWGHQFVSESVLKSTISQLRAALDDDAKSPRYIETASRRGYRFIAPPAAAQAAAAVLDPGHVAEASRGGSGPPVVARGAALDRVQALWRTALQGRRQIMWIAGEPGVGKTTLIDAVAGQLEGAICARGQCVEQFGLGEPYLPVLDALGALCRQDPALPPMVRAIAPTWLLQLPWLSSEADRAAMQHELAGASQDRMLREMGELLDQYTARRPLLLVTEDLHWSDHATVRLIDHLARRRTPSRLLWLGSFRQAELVAEDHPLKGVRQELRAHRLCEEIVLEPFSERQVADFIDLRFPGAAAPDSFVKALHAHTDGLPLFVANVIEDLLLQGVIAPDGAGGIDAGALAAQQTVPESLAGVIEKQIVRLPEDLRLLLGAASVCGMEFRADTVADALSHDPIGVQQSADRLAAQLNWLSALGVARRADGSLDALYTFRHALYRRVFYQRLGAANRAEMHRRVGLSLQRGRVAGMPVAAAELAMHFELGHEPSLAMQHYADAAANAMGLFAPHEAARHSERGLALLPACPDTLARHELELRLVTLGGVACMQLFGVASPQSRAAHERARHLVELLPSTPERAWVMSSLGSIDFARGEFAAAHELAQRIHDQSLAIGDPLLRIAACNLMGRVLCNSAHMDDARRWLETGIAECGVLATLRPLGGFVVDPEVSMHAHLCQPLAQMGLMDAARYHATEALEVACQVGQPISRLLARWSVCMTEVQADDPERVLTMALEIDEIVTEHGLAQGEGPSRWYRGWAMARLGQPQAGCALILEGYERHARFGMFCGCAKVLGYAADAMIFQADWGAAQRHLDDALTLARRIHETVDLPGLLVRQAQIHVGLERVDAARQSLRDAVAAARQTGARAFEVAALVELCTLAAPLAPERQALREACALLPDGFDARLRARALQLL
jgi:DNA-binding winged helix-turn-helix (wHTH) protein/tetratricopeptide (TPR) repeat protein/ABC-type cobalamin/Fe3+-siderophores transport system ATPase subunit